MPDPKEDDDDEKHFSPLLRSHEDQRYEAPRASSVLLN
jgi:hypothetical protein